MSPYCGPCNVLPVVCLYSSMPPIPTHVDMCVEKSPISSDVFIHHHVSWPHATITEPTPVCKPYVCPESWEKDQRDGGHFSVNPASGHCMLTTTLSALFPPRFTLSSIKISCLFWVSSVALHYNRAPPDYLRLRGGQWFMTVFLLLYTGAPLQLSTAANLSKLPQRREHSEPKISSSSERISLSAKRWKCSFREPNE